MNASLTKNKQGFTIIEVVLVLAIAALIFLMVFIALPALQRNQRDTQRKSDVGRFITALNSYSTNNRGAIPDSSANAGRNLVSGNNAGNPGVGGFVGNYLTRGGDTFTDPDGTNYQVDSNDPVPGTVSGAFNRIMYYNSGARCDTATEGAVVAGTARQGTVRMILEGSGVYCQNT